MRSRQPLPSQSLKKWSKKLRHKPPAVITIVQLPVLSPMVSSRLLALEASAARRLRPRLDGLFLQAQGALDRGFVGRVGHAGDPCERRS